MRRAKLLAMIALILLAGCTVHPPGENAERQAALSAGKQFQEPIESRKLPELPGNPSPDQIVGYALLASADLEQRYWEWRSAIEEIPQEGSQPGSLNLSAGTILTRGRASRENSTLGLSNDPMTDIKWPGKLDAAAKQALENARAAGRRFRKAQFELRAKALNAYDDYALNAAMIRLETDNQQLLGVMFSATQSRNSAGSTGEQDILRAANERDLSANDLANLQSQLPAERAAINAILNRPPDAPLAVPIDLPQSGSLRFSDDKLLALAATQNPELQALADEIRGREDGLLLARLQYIPDFNLSAGTDLAGISQSILGQATIPLFRYEALNAAIAQAQADLRATEAMRRQTGNDLNAQVVMDVTTLRDADRQLELLRKTVLPRSRRIVELVRTEYESGQATLLDLLDGERSLIEIERLIANLRVTQARRLSDLEAVTCTFLAGESDPTIAASPAPAMNSGRRAASAD